MSKSTKIRLSLETRELLKDLGKKGESYDAVIRRLMDKAEGR